MRSNKPISLDFNLLPDLSSSSAWILLSDELEASITKLPETYDRAESALHFCWSITGALDVYERTDPKSIKRREGYLRASLAEFVSMEETLARDLVSIGTNSTPIKINHSLNPLLHIIRELRNFEIHLHSASLSSEIREVIFANTNSEIDIWMVGDLLEADFRKLKNAKLYNNSDIPKMLDWFSQAQKGWGVHDLVYRSIVIYCEEIKRAYSL